MYRNFDPCSTRSLRSPSLRAVASSAIAGSWRSQKKLTHAPTTTADLMWRTWPGIHRYRFVQRRLTRPALCSKPISASARPVLASQTVQTPLADRASSPPSSAYPLHTSTHPLRSPPDVPVPAVERSARTPARSGIGVEYRNPAALSQGQYPALRGQAPDRRVRRIGAPDTPRATCTRAAGHFGRPPTRARDHKSPPIGAIPTHPRHLASRTTPGNPASRCTSAPAHRSASRRSCSRNGPGRTNQECSSLRCPQARLARRANPSWNQARIWGDDDGDTPDRQVACSRHPQTPGPHRALWCPEAIGRAERAEV